MQFADVVHSLRVRWRVSVALALAAVLAVAIFLFTRNEIRPDNRYRVEMELLVPAIDDQGARPEGVPPALLQGQETQALDDATKQEALERAEVPTNEHDSIDFGFRYNEARTIIVMSVTADKPDTATTVAGAFVGAYIDTRRNSVATSASTRQITAKRALEQYNERLAEVEAALAAADPALLASLREQGVGAGGTGEGDEGGDAGGAGVAQVPQGTPIETALLAVERSVLLQRIRSTQLDYARGGVEVLVPQPYAQVVESHRPEQITPELPSPLVPILVILGAGLLLAVGIPVLIDWLDHSIRDARSAAEAFEAPVLTSIPAAVGSRRHALVPPGSPADWAYRALAATSIATDRLPEAILVTSPLGQAQDAVAANFAVALAANGLRVALVATDARQSWFLDACGTNGTRLDWPEMLEQAHEGRLNGAVPEGLAPARQPNLLVLPPGEDEEQANLNGLPPLLEALSSSEVDVTVIAGTALLEDPGTTIVAWATRNVLWVCEAGETTEPEAREAASRLALAGGTSFGVALVDGNS